MVFTYCGLEKNPKDLITRDKCATPSSCSTSRFLISKQLKLMYRPTGSGRDLYLTGGNCRYFAHYSSTKSNDVVSHATNAPPGKVYPSGSGRDIYLMQSPPRRGAGALLKDKANQGKPQTKKLYSKALFTESIFPDKSPRPQSSYESRDRKKADRERQRNYMKHLSISVEPNNNKKTTSTTVRPSTAAPAPHGGVWSGIGRKRKEKQRQKFRDATTGRFKGAYFGGLNYAGGVSHGLTWK